MQDSRWLSTENETIAQVDGILDCLSSSSSEDSYGLEEVQFDEQKCIDNASETSKSSSLKTEITSTNRLSSSSLEGGPLFDDSYHLSSFPQLDGSHEIPEQNKFNGLAGISCDGMVIPFITNLFRGIEHYWNQLENHNLCTGPNKK